MESWIKALLRGRRNSFRKTDLMGKFRIKMLMILRRNPNQQYDTFLQVFLIFVFAIKCINLLIRHTLAGSNNIITALVNKRNENNFDI